LRFRRSLDEDDELDEDEDDELDEDEDEDEFGINDASGTETTCDVSARTVTGTGV